MFKPSDKPENLRILNLKLSEYTDYDGSFKIVDVDTISGSLRISSDKPLSDKSVSLLKRLESDLDIKFIR